MNDLHIPLLSILNHPRGLFHLKQFSLSEHSEETVDFIRDVQLFQQLSQKGENSHLMKTMIKQLLNRKTVSRSPSRHILTPQRTESFRQFKHMRQASFHSQQRSTNTLPRHSPSSAHREFDIEPRKTLELHSSMGSHENSHREMLSVSQPSSLNHSGSSTGTLPSSPKHISPTLTLHQVIHETALSIWDKYKPNSEFAILWQPDHLERVEMVIYDALNHNRLITDTTLYNPAQQNEIENFKSGTLRRFYSSKDYLKFTDELLNHLSWELFTRITTHSNTNNETDANHNKQHNRHKKDRKAANATIVEEKSLKMTITLPKDETELNNTDIVMLEEGQTPRIEDVNTCKAESTCQPVSPSQQEHLYNQHNYKNNNITGHIAISNTRNHAAKEDTLVETQSNHDNKTTLTKRTQSVNTTLEHKMKQTQSGENLSPRTQIKQNSEQTSLLNEGFPIYFSNPLGVEILRKFMKAEYSQDNLDAVLAIHEFKQNYAKTDFNMTKLQQDNWNANCKRDALKLYMKFCSEDSKNEVTFNGELRAPLKQALGIIDSKQGNIANTVQRINNATTTQLEENIPLPTNSPHHSTLPTTTVTAEPSMKSNLSPTTTPRPTLKENNSSTANAVNQAVVSSVDANLFDDVLRVVTGTIRSDVFPRFIRSTMSKKILQDLRDRYWQLKQLHEQSPHGLSPDRTSPGIVPLLSPLVFQQISSPSHQKRDNNISTARVAARDEVKRICAKYHWRPPCFEDILSDSDYFNSFVRFCTQEHSEENPLFIQAVKRFKRLYKAKQGVDVEQCITTAKTIYDKFIALESEFEIQLPNSLRQAIECALKFPHCDMFNESLKLITSAIKEDSVKRYLRSEELALCIRHKAKHIQQLGKQAVNPHNLLFCF